MALGYATGTPKGAHSALENRRSQCQRHEGQAHVRLNQALAGLRQLCCSGLSVEVVITEFLHAVQDLIPSCSNTFSGCADDLAPRYHLCSSELCSLVDQIPEIVSGYLTPERLKRAADWLTRHPVIDDPRVLDPDFYSSILYGDLYRRLDMHHVLWAPTSLNGRANGMLGLYRPASQRPFSQRDHQVLAQLIPYVSHALRPQGTSSIEFAADGQSGLLIADRSGVLLYDSPDARALLEKACHPRVTCGSADRSAVAELIRALCRDLDSIFRGCPAPAPNRCHIGPMGRFDFRAYPLDGKGADPQALIGILLEYREPVLLRLMRAVRTLPLSPTQKEVAILLARGAPYESIGRSLGIKTTTVKDHVGKIYDKMAVRRREDLLTCLLAAQATMTAQMRHRETLV